MDINHTQKNILAASAIRAFLDHTDAYIFVKDRNGRYVNASEPFVQMTGHISLAEIVGRDDFEIFENQELAKRYVEDDQKLLADGNDLVHYVEPITDKHGHARYSSTSKYVLRDGDGEIVGILGISQDVTKEYRMQQRHQQELKYLFELPEDTYAALFMDIEDWRIIQHRRQTGGTYILPIQESMEDFAANALTRLAEPINEDVQRFYRNLSKASMLDLCGRGVRQHTMEYLRRMPNGQNLWVRVDIHFIIDPETGHLCAIWLLRNIDSTIRTALDLRQAAERDELTGLLNRACTMKQIRQIMADQPDAMHALFALDLDCFKALNDTMGHQAGDAFLVAFAKALKGCFRDSDVVGRVGGDEFFVLMKNVPNDMIIAEKAETVMRISRLLCDFYPVEGLSVSIGISLFPADGADISSLYAKADEALYHAKRSGKNRCCIAGQKILQITT